MKYLPLFLGLLLFVTSCQEKETCKICEYKIDNDDWILLDVYCDNEIVNTLENHTSIQYENMEPITNPSGSLTFQMVPKTLEDITGVPSIDIENFFDDLQIRCQNL